MSENMAAICSSRQSTYLDEQEFYKRFVDFEDHRGKKLRYRPGEPCYGGWAIDANGGRYVIRLIYVSGQPTHPFVLESGFEDHDESWTIILSLVSAEWQTLESINEPNPD